MSRLAPAFVLATLALLSGCDQLGLESASAVAERRLADGKAVGGACRHASRAIEDCYTLNRKTDKAAIYAGWREMDDYMRENKLTPVLPVIPAVEPRTRSAEAEEPAAADDAASKPAKGDKLAKADKTESVDLPARPKKPTVHH
jgi:predicted  nucleic acid-binding Zn-ribbon protein